ncbi:MAG TPA: DUF2007 domain-containing protein [Armatimonadota bacterium]
MSDESLVPIYEANSMTEATLYQAMLREAGIESMCRPAGNSVVTSAVYQIPPLQYALVVLQRDAEEARRLVMEFGSEAQSGELQLPATEPTLAESPTAANVPTEVRFMARSRRIGRVILLIWLLLFVLLILFAVGHYAASFFTNWYNPAWPLGR